MKGQSPEHIAPVHESLTGSVLPDTWDGDYRVTGVVIACEGERELAVSNLSSHPHLSDLCRSMIRVSGMTSRHGGREEIFVEDFRLLDPDTGITMKKGSKK